MDLNFKFRVSLVSNIMDSYVRESSVYVGIEPYPWAC